MASRRMIASDIFEDEFVGFLNFFGRLVWIGMIVVCADDQGRMFDSSPLIRAKTFPFDKNITDDKVDEVLAKAAKEGKIVRYEAAGKLLLQVVHWWDYQQPAWASASKYPAPEGWMDRIRCHIAGNKIYSLNWEETGGFIEGYQGDVSNSLRSGLHSTLRSSIDEGEGENKGESESLSLSAPVKEFLDLAGLKKFPKGSEALLKNLAELIRENGVEKTLGCAKWVWQKPDMTLARAISSMQTAVPGWTIDTPALKSNGNGHHSTNAGGNPLADELARRKAARESDGDRIGS